MRNILVGTLCAVAILVWATEVTAAPRGGRGRAGAGRGRVGLARGGVGLGRAGLGRSRGVGVGAIGGRAGIGRGFRGIGLGLGVGRIGLGLGGRFLFQGIGIGGARFSRIGRGVSFTNTGLVIPVQVQVIGTTGSSFQPSVQAGGTVTSFESETTTTTSSGLIQRLTRWKSSR